MVLPGACWFFLLKVQTSPDTAFAEQDHQL